MKAMLLPVRAGCLFLLCWAFAVQAAPPANDSIENAELIPAEGDGTSVLFEDATTVPSDPVCGSPVFQTVWYRYTPAVDGFVVSQLWGFLSEPRPRVSVWTGSPGALVLAQCHPDADAAELPVQAGVTYYFMVHQAAPTPQNGSLSFDVLPLTWYTPPAPQPPVNDLFWFAPSRSAAFEETVDLGAAIADVYDPPVCVGSYLANSVWYRFVPPVSGSYDAIIAPDADYELPYAAVFTGPGGLDQLQPHSCSKQGERKPGGTRFQAVAGQPYYLQMASETRYETSVPAVVTVRATPPATAGAAVIHPNAGYTRTVQFIEVLFVTTSMPVKLAFTCAAPIAEPLAISVTITQGAYQATGTGTGSCADGSGSAVVNVVYRSNQLATFHRGAAVATATLSGFDANYDVSSGPTAITLGGN